MKHLLLAPLFAFAVSASAQVIVKDPWVRATVPEQKSTGAFMEITASKDAALVEVRTPVAANAEIHEMAMQDNIMKMRQVSGIELPSGKAVALKPGGYHLMLTGLKHQVKEGDSVPLTLTVEYKDKKRETIELKVPARPLGGMQPKH